MVEQHAHATGKRLAGYYCAAAEVVQEEAAEPPAHALAFVEQIEAHYPGAVLLRVQNAQLAAPNATPFDAFTATGEPVTGLKVVPAGLQAFDKATKRGQFAACRALVDMDEHWEDATRDFRNGQVADLLR